ncbi:MAG: hypothetical protein JSR66_01270 [Proteobacteria bacterium]|nr:hypothetical protein [Pseudomonadota bacterium]
MAKPICPQCSAKIVVESIERWGLWKINRGRRICPSCQSGVQFRRNLGTLYLRVPALLFAQMVVGVALEWEPLRAGSIELGTAKLVMAAWVVVPSAISMAALILLPGSIFEDCGIDER